MPKLGIEIKRKCKFCGKAFIIKTLDSIYCCKKCSEAAYAKKKRAEAKEKKLALIAKSVPKLRDYISIREAVAIYGVERDTLYLMVRRGQIPSINIGTKNVCEAADSQTHQGNAITKEVQSRTRGLLHHWRSLREVSHQRQFRMGARQEVFHSLSSDW